MTEDFDTAVRSILGQMIEAREDQNDADKQLQDYRAANGPPEVPNEFEDVDDPSTTTTAGRATRMISGNTTTP